MYAFCVELWCFVVTVLPTVYLITIQQTVSKPQREIRNMSRIQRIETILTEKCAPSHLAVHNFSHEHKGPADAQTHMKAKSPATK
jgi:stress-induced morphogen